MKLRHALKADWPSIVDLWVDAFAEDPYFRWVQPDRERWPAFGSAWMTFILERVFERGHTYVDETIDVAVAWLPPDVSFVGTDDIAVGRAILAEHGGEARADEAFAMIVAARAHTLDASHWTLQYIGVRPALQGKGLGDAAVAPILDVCDATSLPCGLVSTNDRNVSFYERHGFRVAAEVPASDGGAVLRPMHRLPDPSGS